MTEVLAGIGHACGCFLMTLAALLLLYRLGKKVFWTDKG